jgi:hypothetical protein
MKKLTELSKIEKVKFLQKVQTGEVNPRSFKGQPVFLTKGGDSFLSVMQGQFSGAVPITPEGVEDKTKFDEVLNEAKSTL